MDATTEEIVLDIKAGAAAANGAGSVNGAAGAQAASDLTAYPILTEEISYPSSPRPSGGAGGGSAGGGGWGQLIEGAVRDVLGWRPDTRKPGQFVAALNQAFQIKEVDGHTEWTWTPRSYAVQTDMGAVTGAQASIYTRARQALEAALPLLDGLYSLRADIVPDDQRAIREVARQQMEQLTAEFGTLGGPRVPRIDELFAQLLGRQIVTDPELLPSRLNSAVDTSTLGELRDRFGLVREHVNTVDDEQDLTNYLVIVDYFNGLRQGWSAQKPYFSLSTATLVEPYLGTQLVLLSRALEVVAEAVNEVYFAMDSVFLGPAERQTTQLQLAGLSIKLPGELSEYALGDSDLFVADLLDWVYRVASDEGPRAIQTGGKDGVTALAPSLDQLRHLTQAALLQSRGGKQDPGLSPGYRTARVQVALQALAKQVNAAFQSAREVRPQQAIP
jgi:hypothetical protein